MFQHGGDRILDAIAEMLTLRCQVDEGRNRPYAVFIHALLSNSLRNLPRDKVRRAQPQPCGRGLSRY
jgi:hypothetical protein